MELWVLQLVGPQNPSRRKRACYRCLRANHRRIAPMHIVNRHNRVFACRRLRIPYDWMKLAPYATPAMRSAKKAQPGRVFERRPYYYSTKAKPKPERYQTNQSKEQKNHTRFLRCVCVYVDTGGCPSRRGAGSIPNQTQRPRHSDVCGLPPGKGRVSRGQRGQWQRHGFRRGRFHFGIGLLLLC